MTQSDDSLRARLAEWERETLGRKLAERPERKPEFTTQAMHWPVNRLYTPQDLEAVGFDYLRDVGFPGEFPYTRGTEPNGYRSDLWTMMQVTGFGTGDEWAKRGRYMLEQGLTGLFLEYDLPTTNGYDSDHPLAAGEVGRAGIALDSLDDMEALLDLPFDKLQRLTSICNGPQTDQPGDDPLRPREARGRPGLVHAADAQRDPDRVHLRRSLHLSAGSRSARRDRRHRVQHQEPSQLDPDLGGQRAALRRPRQSRPGAGLLVRDRDGVPRRVPWPAASTSTTSPPTSPSSPGVDMDFFEAVGKMRAYRKIWARIMRDEYGDGPPGVPEAAAHCVAGHDVADAAAAAQQHRAPRRSRCWPARSPRAATR